MADTYGSNAMRSNGPSISMIDNGGAIGVGNYKGVMLCNRPFGGSTVTNKIGSSTATKTQFTCGVVPESLGLNVAIAATDKYKKRPNKDSVLTKHKKWLSDLEKTKNQLAAQLMDESNKKDEEKARFQDHEKRMREVARTLLNVQLSDAKSSSDDKESSASYPESKSSYQEMEDKMLAQLQRQNNNISFDADTKKPSTSSSTSGHKASAKPAWAMTEKACEDASDDIDFSGADDLIDFAKGLDFDKYIGDIEVKTMMDRLRKRISEYEREIAQDEARGVDALERAAKRELLTLMGQAESSLHQEQYSKMSDENIAMSNAKALLNDEDELQAVHSTKSVSVLLKQAKDKINSVKDSVRKPGPPAEAKVWNEPLVVIHDSGDGARLELKNAISKLPYVHRNPAV